MEVPPTVWVDIARVVCFATVVVCKKLWKWYQEMETKLDKPKHQVSLPELVTDLISIKEQKKPEEESDKFEDAPEQSMITQPKVAAVVP